MSERRKTDRRRCYIGGYIEHAGAQVECLLRNRTAIGARLELSGPWPLPRRFQLNLPNRQEAYSASVAWRSGRSLGVALTPRRLHGATRT
jgi:hypothetical protein